MDKLQRTDGVLRNQRQLGLYINGNGFGCVGYFGQVCVFFIFSYFYENMGFSKTVGLDGFGHQVILFFAEDFSFIGIIAYRTKYGFCGLHPSNHHSSQNFNLVVALRQSWTEVFYKYSFYIWLAILGFSADYDINSSVHQFDISIFHPYPKG